MLMAWEGSDRRDRLPADWPVIQRRILRRDGHRCTVIRSDGRRCRDKATEVDHIKRGDDHADDNLRAICTWHHARKSAREGGQAAAQKRREAANRFRRAEAHPGLLA
ncbi:HNH endonuclease [Catenuloplanes sp. NPDC051500]|uniref:HNH endonuclease n=1 Tax=Catenuloplanes sp. NPDC051500 TaxID=3363959 RepID=UPI00379B6254